MGRFLRKQNLFIFKLVLEAFDSFARRVFAAKAECQPEREREHPHQSVNDCGDDGIGDSQLKQDRQHCEGIDRAAHDRAQELGVFYFQFFHRRLDQFFKNIGNNYRNHENRGRDNHVGKPFENTGQEIGERRQPKYLNENLQEHDHENPFHNRAHEFRRIDPDIRAFQGGFPAALLE